MQAKTAYLLLCIAGAMIPLSAFAPWVQTHGLDLRLLIADLFGNRVSAFFGLDVLVSALVVVLWAAIERTRHRAPFWWAPILATIAVGVSCGLPLLLYLKERDRSTARVAAT